MRDDFEVGRDVFRLLLPRVRSWSAESELSVVVSVGVTSEELTLLVLLTLAVLAWLAARATVVSVYSISVS